MRAWLLAALLASTATPAADDFERYVKQAERFKQQRDADELDDKPVLGVLKLHGLLEKAEDGSFRTGFRPFQVRAYNGIWRWPLKAGIVSSEFGRRRGKRHQGIDIAADSGEAVFAAAPGRVLFSGESRGGYGNVIIVRHDEKTTSLYAHNEKLLVKEGATVQSGQKIALLGSTGRSTGPHVHFEIRVRAKAVNPRKRLVKSRF